MRLWVSASVSVRHGTAANPGEFASNDSYHLNTQEALCSMCTSACVCAHVLGVCVCA